MKIRRQQPSPTVAVESLRYQIKLPDSEPQNILEKIVWHKEKEVEKMRDRMSLLDLRKKVAELTSSPLDFLGALTNSVKKPALIAEVKKASPSKGVIKPDFDPISIAQSYEKGGASCLSVLTDAEFFQGSFENLAKVRNAVKLPLLCKEFIIYPYQIYLARLNGADAVLLIASILKDTDLRYFLKIIHSLKMTALIEVHTLEELDRVLTLDEVKLIGINNRNLENFEVSLDTTKNILSARKETIINRNILIVSESGLYTKNDLDFVQNAGANAVLIGESLIKQDDLESAIKNLYK
ncbi:indole-3-glycerol phosphate synthase TrpC [Geminocystis herdmanii]|uniref:indole-3-glycerol phosphate synthase TrpC n=1 Tax=Geminocystis herdmanii TaxID=669359 RepID=UPI0003470D32|nr:indole-3-glycerol phosphate synthase TrpC [Geminocystis herdmanii]